MTCKKYMEELDIKLTFEEIAKMSKFSFKKLLKEKTKVAALKYLNLEKTKQSKVLGIQFEKLVMQEYLLNGDRNSAVSKLIFKARTKTLDIKSQKSWKYEDLLCSGCKTNDESEQELFSCKYFGENVKNIDYSWFFSENWEDQVSAGKLLMEKLKIRKKLREEIT